MGSKSITKPEGKAIIVPSLELPNLTTAITELKTEAEKLAELDAKAKAIVCDSPMSYAELVKIVDEMQDIGKLGEKKMRPFLDVANKVCDFLLSEKKNQDAAAKIIWQPHELRASIWKREEREAAEREQQKLRDEEIRIANEKAAEQRRVDEAAAAEKRKARVAEIRGMLKSGTIGKRKAEQLLREAGATEEAALAKAAADADEIKANAGTAQVLPNIPTVEGRRGGVEYFAEMLNGTLLISELRALIGKSGTPENMARIDYLMRFVIVDESAVRKEAKEVKDSKKMATLIPGFKFTDKDRV